MDERCSRARPSWPSVPAWATLVLCRSIEPIGDEATALLDGRPRSVRVEVSAVRKPPGDGKLSGTWGTSCIPPFVRVSVPSDTKSWLLAVGSTVATSRAVTPSWGIPASPPGKSSGSVRSSCVSRR
jgi:hypothetical protein